MNCRRIYEKRSIPTPPHRQNGRTSPRSHGTNGYAGRSRLRSRRRENSMSSGSALNSRRECAGHAVGPAAPIAKNDPTRIHPRSASIGARSSTTGRFRSGRSRRLSCWQTGSGWSRIRRIELKTVLGVRRAHPFVRLAASERMGHPASLTRMSLFQLLLALRNNNESVPVVRLIG
jgi:hypothetical protein